jgi:histidyl-tRNA synthetase
MMIAEPPPELRPIAIVPTNEETEREAVRLAQRLREDGFSIDQAFAGNVGKRLKRANKVNARAAVILGADEWARGAVVVKAFDTGTQIEVALAQVTASLRGLEG